MDVKLQLMPCVQMYRHCSQTDISGLKDPRLNEQTIISALYNLGRLLDDDGRHQVELIYLLVQCLLCAGDFCLTVLNLFKDILCFTIFMFALLSVYLTTKQGGCCGPL